MKAHELRNLKIREKRSDKPWIGDWLEEKLEENGMELIETWYVESDKIVDGWIITWGWKAWMDPGYYVYGMVRSWPSGVMELWVIDVVDAEEEEEEE